MTPITYRLRSGTEVRALRHHSGAIFFADYRIHRDAPPTFAPDGTNLDEPAFLRISPNSQSSKHENAHA